MSVRRTLIANSVSFKLGNSQVAPKARAMSGRTMACSPLRERRFSIAHASKALPQRHQRSVHQPADVALLWLPLHPVLQLFLRSHYVVACGAGMSTWMDREGRYAASKWLIECAC